MSRPLKMDLMGQWIEDAWKPRYPALDLMTLWVPDAVVHQTVLKRFERDKDLDGYHFDRFESETCPVVVEIANYAYSGDLTYRTGAYRFYFSHTESGKEVEALVVASYYTDDGYLVCLGCMPEAFMPIWTLFSNECERLSRSLAPTPEVVIIGGRSASFVPTVDWEDVILPFQLKTDLMEDVESFFSKGVEVYKRLKLKPFRKLLLAGVPGTGKTMLCSALAKWALEREYLVIYISSADQSGSTFGKIEHALAVASRSSHPTLILLEELDAYLHEQEKAIVLNVLDGSESLSNEKGSLLIATTNYPEAIDERVLKRPGRLDRIYIIPETKDQDDAEKMLRKYLGHMWQEEHRALVDKLVGFPGAFIREVAIYALTQVAYDDLAELTYGLLEASYNRLREQINVKDDFLVKKPTVHLGFGSNSN